MKIEWATHIDIRGVKRQFIAFVPTPSGRKVMCPVCTRDGYGLEVPTSHLDAAPWQKPCMLNPEHTYRCVCGMRYPNAMSIAAHINGMRQHHPLQTHQRKAVA